MPQVDTFDRIVAKAKRGADDPFASVALVTSAPSFSVQLVALQERTAPSSQAAATLVAVAAAIGATAVRQEANAPRAAADDADDGINRAALGSFAALQQAANNSTSLTHSIAGALATGSMQKVTLNGGKEPPEKIKRALVGLVAGDVIMRQSSVNNSYVGPTQITAHAMHSSIRLPDNHAQNFCDMGISLTKTHGSKKLPRIDLDAQFEAPMRELNVADEALIKWSFDNFGTRNRSFMLNLDKDKSTAPSQCNEWVTGLLTTRGVCGSNSSRESNIVDEALKLDDTDFKSVDQALADLEPDDFDVTNSIDDPIHVLVANFAEQYANNAAAWHLKMVEMHGDTYYEDAAVTARLPKGPAAMMHLNKSDHGAAAAAGAGGTHERQPDPDLAPEVDAPLPTAAVGASRKSSLFFDNPECSSTMAPGLKADLKSAEAVALLLELCGRYRQLVIDRGAGQPGRVLQEELPTWFSSDMNPIARLVMMILKGQHDERATGIAANAGGFHAVKRAMTAAGNIFGPTLMTWLLRKCGYNDVNLPYLLNPGDPNQVSQWWAAFVHATDVVKTIQCCRAKSMDPGDSFDVRSRDVWVLGQINRCPNSWNLHWMHRNAVSMFSMMASPGMMEIPRQDRFNIFCSMEKVQVVMFCIDHATDYLKWAIYMRLRPEMHSTRCKFFYTQTGWIASTVTGKDEFEDLHVENLQRTIRGNSESAHNDMHKDDRQMAHHFANTKEIAAVRTESRKDYDATSNRAAYPVTQHVPWMVSAMLKLGFFSGKMIAADGKEIPTGSFECATPTVPKDTAPGSEFARGYFDLLQNRSKGLGKYAQGIFKGWAHYDKNLPGPDTLFAKVSPFAANAAALAESVNRQYSIVSLKDMETAKCRVTNKLLFPVKFMAERLEDRKRTAEPGSAAASLPDSFKNVRQPRLRELLSGVRERDGTVDPPESTVADLAKTVAAAGLPNHGLLAARANTATVVTHTCPAPCAPGLVGQGTSADVIVWPTMGLPSAVLRNFNTAAVEDT